MTPIDAGRLILASRSPRRRELLTEAGYEFDAVLPDEAAEGELPDVADPVDLVTRLARDKAADVARRVASGIVIGCDTVAACEGQILGKPTDERDARRMLELLSGREQSVHSGLCLWPVPGDEPLVRTAETRLRMHRLNDEQLDEYLASGMWRGKAGAFGLQDRLGWLEIVTGGESNVVGLPLELLAEMFAELNWGGTP